MKKFIKNNVKIISTIIVTAVLCISGTVYATTKYLSSDVTYKDTTVENALNDLYDYNEKNKCVKGTVQHAANSQLEINLGFDPTIILVSHMLGSEYDYNFYDKRFNNNIWYAYSGSSNDMQANVTMKITDGILKTSYYTSWDRYKYSYTVYYFACK